LYLEEDFEYHDLKFPDDTPKTEPIITKVEMWLKLLLKMMKMKALINTTDYLDLSDFFYKTN